MKQKTLALLAVFTIFLNACEKQQIVTSPLASLTVANILADGNNIILGTNITPVYNNYFQGYSVLAGNQHIKLVGAGDEGKVYFDQSAEFVNGGIYSLFLAGTPNSVESVFVKEESIVQHTDNTIGVRVINLSTGNLSISVNVSGSAHGSLVSALGYRKLSDFKQVSASESQTFEFRNAMTGNLILTFDIPDYDIPRFRNITLLFSGSAGSEKVLRINNY